ncbi:rubrerythrin [Parasulfuritortus cantonensis]|uniref:Rubrerythrin n=1 Tax=Parasulfuritortus cantonensis TaxID=2528202 RepID=A0A4V2NV32_9PROT|nr:ferritin family protein [Parasulfuritortus cantonensis]TCJ11946.1 rubrerythrin [Parasulfuritortus cantonensis]
MPLTSWLSFPVSPWRGSAGLRFSDLSEQQILSLAIALEEEDARIYNTYAEVLAEEFPDSAKLFRAMAAEEDGHRHRLIELYRQRFGERILLIRRQDVRGFVERKPVWLIRPLDLEKIRAQAEIMEADSRRFYAQAARHTTDAAIRQLLGDLAAEESRHESQAERLGDRFITPDAVHSEHQTQRRLFVLQFVQPGLAGLMDGSVSTLAPLFAAAFATHDTWSTFLVGLAAAIGSGISMAFAEALSDDGALTGRGSPFLRGWVIGLMTTVGGLGHALPYLIPHFELATALAFAVVAVELGLIAWIRKRYMDTPFGLAVLQVVVGGLLVFALGIAIGSA